MSLAQVAYPDCSPVMILSEASLADLNTRMEKKVKINNFRPNIVVTGCSAFEEVSGSLLLCIMSRGAPTATAAAAKSLQSCPTLCDPIDGSPLGSSVPEILQARIREWVAISFSNA